MRITTIHYNAHKFEYEREIRLKFKPKFYFTEGINSVDLRRKKNWLCTVARVGGSVRFDVCIKVRSFPTLNQFALSCHWYQIEIQDEVFGRF